MTEVKKFLLQNMPFLIGMFDKPQNPDGFPNTLPFTYWYDEEYSILRQDYSDNVKKYLDIAYKTGSLLGTPMDQDGFGQKYMNDFFKFILSSAGELDKKTVLEIGCGKGYLLKKLQDKCLKVVGIEPGSANKSSWDILNVDVVNDFFPSPKCTEKFDLIVSFCVLEHIPNYVQFIKNMISQLNKDGSIIIGVPNCEEQLDKADPSIFVHEHYSYYGMNNLVYFLSQCGLTVTKNSYSEYGGLLYIHAIESKNKSTNIVSKPAFDIDLFSEKYKAFCLYIEQQVSRIQSEGKTLGIYCAARALAGLPLTGQYRFFDDDPHIYNLYYPPFDAPVENMQDLIRNPVDELWIFSYSFADAIEQKISKFDNLKNMNIVNLKQISQKIIKDNLL